MRKLDIDHIQPGSKLSRTIYSANGQILLRQGTSLSSKYIQRLKRMGYTSIYIDDGLMDDIILDENISEETRLQTVTCIKEVMENVKYSKSINTGHVKKTVSKIVDDIMCRRELMLNLSDIRSHDDYTFYHSVNVTVISVIIGICLYYNYDQLCDLGLGVLLHDIGKTQIPLEILGKPDRLTQEEYEIIKKHTWYGFEALRSNPEIKITSAHVALQHHERYNGSGYPRQLKGEDILEFARITAIADVYDAMSNDRCYRKKIPIHKVRQYLTESSGTLFDSKILNRFIEKVAFYPQGTKVILNNGESGVVIRQNNVDPIRPVLRLFWYNGILLPKPKEINLLDHPSLSIVKVIES